MTEKHLSSQFDSDLNEVSTKVMEMGGLIESQIRAAMASLSSYSIELADQVIKNEPGVDDFEINIDHLLISVIARRQPAARDLRLLLAISKITANLERVGDEAKKIAKRAKSLIESGKAREMPIGDLRLATELATKLIHQALDALARLDIESALTILKDDDEIDREFKGFTRMLITYMMEDPRTISGSLDLLFVAKAIERIGDHAKNIAECIIYIVKGEDVRHSSLETIESIIK
ncbi:MAG: phosphate signaling complex protein PhoU [Burkholderiales bacterium]|jgi:phosphate transport system protein|nr:phosphate signaling complex protein PhoU [Burkholderiales bacterium]